MQRRTAGKPGIGGFTLIELMVTIVVVSILASIAVPAYTHQIRKSRRTDARTALLELASREERYLAVNNAYTNDPASLGYSAFGTAVGSGYYQLSTPTVNAATATSAPTFSLTASPVSGKGQDLDTDCASFTVDSTGKQSSVNSGGSDTTSVCWQ